MPLVNFKKYAKKFKKHHKLEFVTKNLAKFEHARTTSRKVENFFLVIEEKKCVAVRK